MKGIILHGGHGTRLRPLTHTGPKQLLPIANKPMSQYGVEVLKESGIKEIAIIVGGIGSNKVREYYGDGEKFGVKFTYIEQDYPKGISHAIGLCKEFIQNEKFVVFLGDNIIQRSIKDYVAYFQNSNFDALLLLCEVDNPSRFGIADVKNEKILKIIEKPKNPPTNLAVTGIYFLTPLIFDIIEKLKPSWRNELEITDALDILREKNDKITYRMITDYWKDTGTPEDILNANSAILEKVIPYFDGKKEENVRLNGNVIVGKNTIIKDDVVINGPAIIGDDCIIEKKSIIGPNVSIGDNSVVSQCSIKNSIVMSDCEVKCNISIKDSIISKNSVIQTNQNNNEKIFMLGEGTKVYL
ncbi:glucose-1-phosphate thymidylyltransferase [Nitrosopumilus sp.]|uniref:glucose-1-phosphate thymidylyltransferase n=1 Tax=Nitrosopumilus sp. TaxID=2024843 RepID=UPI003D0C101B